MQTRHLINDSAAVLEKKSEAAWDNLDALESIAHELSFRSTKQAIKLRRQVSDRLTELKGSSHSDADVKKLKSEINALRSALVDSERLQRQLEQKLLDAMKRNQRSPNAELYELIGATEGIPDIGLKALRTAYRKAYHPDHFPEDEKKAAERKFQEFENVFDRISAHRGRKF